MSLVIIIGFVGIGVLLLEILIKPNKNIGYNS